MKKFKLFLKLAVTILCLIWVFSQKSFDFESFKRSFTPFAILCILSVIGISYIVNNWRWLILYRSQGFKISVKDSLSLMFIGVFFNSVIPGGVSGDIVKGVYLAPSAGERGVNSATTLLVDRLIGLFSMVLAAFVACLFSEDLLSDKNMFGIFIALGSILFGFIIAFSFMFSGRLYNHFLLQKIYATKFFGPFKKIHEALFSYREKPVVLLTALLISFLSLTLSIMSLMLAAYFMGFKVSPGVFIFCVPIGMVLTAIPISPGGVGYGQAIYMYLFDIRTGEKSPIGASIFTQAQILGTFWILIGCLFYLRFKQKRGMP